MPVVLAIVFIYLGHFKNVYDDDDDDEQNNQSTGPACYLMLIPHQKLKHFYM